jgi:hypothetical protein
VSHAEKLFSLPSALNTLRRESLSDNFFLSLPLPTVQHLLSPMEAAQRYAIQLKAVLDMTPPDHPDFGSVEALYTGAPSQETPDVIRPAFPNGGGRDLHTSDASFQIDNHQLLPRVMPAAR